MADDHRHPLLPAVLIVGVAAISTAAVLIKLCADAPAVVIAAARMGIAALLLGPGTFAVRRRSLLCLPPGRLGQLVLGGTFLAAHFLFWVSSLKHTSVLSSVVIVTTNPIFVGIASFLLFRERPGRRLMTAVVLAGVGGALIALADAGRQSGSLYGDALALGGAIMASAYFLVGRAARREVPFLSYITVVYSVAAALLVAAALAAGQSFGGYAPVTYLYFALLAVVPQLLGHSSLNWSLRYMTATAVAVVVLAEPVGSTVLAWLILEEPITTLQIVGGALILTGAFLGLRNPSRATNP